MLKSEKSHCATPSYLAVMSLTLHHVCKCECDTVTCHVFTGLIYLELNKNLLISVKIKISRTERSVITDKIR